MLNISTILKYYKQPEIQKAIISNAKGREVAIRFGDNGFGKRPDTLNYPRDILELAKQGATSFHASEELWKNPLQLDPDMKKKDAEELRLGWDLILDIDCEVWNISKITAWLIIESLKQHKIKSVSCKFSGNKGFHIAVPFESFPGEIDGKETKNGFPDTARSVAKYLLGYISTNYIKIKGDNITFGDKFDVSFSRLKEVTGKDIDELTEKRCSDCNSKVDNNKVIVEFICPKCSSSIKANEKFRKCDKCNIFMQRLEHKKGCKCGSSNSYRKFNPLSIIDVDTILISSRHLYRMPYSLHEKSGLVSVPIDPDRVLKFSKKTAETSRVKARFPFLDKKNVVKNEAKELLERALKFDEKKEHTESREGSFEMFAESVPEQFFPPCITNILSGLEDGRKRALFILANFLTSAGWDYESIEKKLKEWNKKNSEELREVLIKGQIRYHKQRKKKILPPNCQNKMYYVDMRVCNPDNLCRKIKNPVNYCFVRAKSAGRK